MLPIKKIYVDIRFMNLNSASSSDFTIDLPQSYTFPDNAVAYIDDVCIPQQNLNRALEVEIVANTSGRRNHQTITIDTVRAITVDRPSSSGEGNGRLRCGRLLRRRLFYPNSRHERPSRALSLLSGESRRYGGEAIHTLAGPPVALPLRSTAGFRGSQPSEQAKQLCSPGLLWSDIPR
jgi:hypothetical protein